MLLPMTAIVSICVSSLEWGAYTIDGGHHG